MKSQIKKLEKAQVEFTIEVSAEEVQPFLEKSAVKISENTKIEGFRPGKAPYDIVKQKVGDMAILQEAMDAIIHKTYYDALQEHKIMSIGQPKIDIEKLAPGNPFVYKAIVDVLPEVTVGDYTKLELKRKEIEPNPEEVKKTIEHIRKMRAKQNLVDRPAKKDDMLEIDFEVLVDKVAIENGSHKKYPITIGEERFIPGFEDQLVGIKKDEDKTFELSFPEKYHDKKIAGKKAEFKVKCLAVYEMEMSDINDAFAGEISNGQFKSVKELEKNIEENIATEEKNKQEQALEIEMLKKIVEISQFSELPEALVENEIEKMTSEMEQGVSKQGLQFDDYLKSIKKTKDDIKKDFREQAVMRVKTAIIAREIYQEKKITVRPDEVDKEIEEMLKQHPGNEEVRKQLETETYKDYIANRLGNRKVIEHLKETVIK